MSDYLVYYERVSPTTWVYLSSLLMISLFFKFNRLWSVRNLDLIGLILLAPGLLFVIYGQERTSQAYEQTGYIWLFAVGGLFLIRMLLDPLMVRRPLLEPNLSVGGLTFLGLSLLIFLMGNVLTDQPMEKFPLRDLTPDATDSTPVDTSAPIQAENEHAKPANPPVEEPLSLYGPGYPWVFEIFQLPSRFLFPGDRQTEPSATLHITGLQTPLKLATARSVAIFSYLAIVIGLVVIGYRHFDNIKTGIAAATLYLLLPYTAILTGRYMDTADRIGQVYHVLLAALVVWAVAMYRRPLVSGILLGLAIGMFYYPIFLLPLWCSFYWQRGVARFAVGVVSMLVILVAILYFHPYGPSFSADIRQMFGWIFPRLNVKGFWGLSFNDPVYRIPVLAAFVAMCLTLMIWPAQKNLGTLLSCSAAVMLGIQFWHALGGGQLLGWYLPLTLLTIFRPNLEDRVALSVLNQWSFAKRKPPISSVDQAA